MKPAPGQATDVVAQAEEEEHDHEHEAERPGALHHPVGNRFAPHLLDQAPEDVAPVERQEGEEVDQAEREADDRQQRQRLAGADLDRLVGDVAHQTIGLGAREALVLLAIVSLSLGVINLFPFLPLDGGHIFWSLVEKVRGSPVPFSVIERAGALGFVLVIMLFVIGLTNDIGRLTGDGFNVR